LNFCQIDLNPSLYSYLGCDYTGLKLWDVTVAAREHIMVGPTTVNAFFMDAERGSPGDSLSTLIRLGSNPCRA
jgi:hypothetical protein